MSTTTNFIALTACQVRAARAMARMSVAALAKASKISQSSIRRVESTWGVPDGVSLDLLVDLQTYFQRRGFVFTFDETSGPGVAWPTYPGRAKKRRRG